MKSLIPFIAVLAFGLAGCHHDDVTIKGDDGSEVKVSQNGSKVEVNGADGSKATVSNDGSKVEVKNDKGETYSSETGSVSEAVLGLPFYPGSTEKIGASMMADTKEGKTVVSSRTTKDDPDKVRAFYADKVHSENLVTSDANNTKMVIMGGKQKDGRVISISIQKHENEDTDVAISVNTPKAK